LVVFDVLLKTRSTVFANRPLAKPLLGHDIRGTFAVAREIGD
jgi:hypothetical protein